MKLYSVNYMISDKFNTEFRMTGNMDQKAESAEDASGMVVGKVYDTTDFFYPRVQVLSVTELKDVRGV